MNSQGSNIRRDQIEISAGKKVALCRCLASKKLPYCDGSHNSLPDNTVGPIIVTCTQLPHDK